MNLTQDEVMRLVALRIEILRSKGHTEAEIEGDIEGYLQAMKNPTTGQEKFIENQKGYLKYWNKSPFAEPK